jgi:hypothetical protein
MIRALPAGTVRHDHRLVAIREHADRAIGLVFEMSGRSVETTADLVWDDVVQLGPDASPALLLAFPGGRLPGRRGADR